MAKFTFYDLWCSTSDIIYTSFQSVVFCLVDIYIMLGKAFVPYLEGLSSTQLRLVTIYANRISQARSGAPIDANQ
jgi:CLIP-associating protein 1/2